MASPFAESFARASASGVKPCKGGRGIECAKRRATSDGDVLVAARNGCSKEHDEAVARRRE